MKTCRKCGETKPKENFYISHIIKDGLYSYCKQCCRKIDLEHKNKPEAKKRIKAYNESRKESMREYSRKRKREFKEEFAAKRRFLRKNCPKTKIFKALEKRIGKLIGSYSVAKLTGCGRAFLKEYLESLFKEGMSWDNYGGTIPNSDKHWEIDHIRPCSSFDLSDPEQQKECFHYTNLQPLWRIDNLRKGMKYTPPEQ